MKQLSEFMRQLCEHYPTPPTKNHYISTKKWNDNEVILNLVRLNAHSGKYFETEVLVEAWNDKTPQQFINDLLIGLPPVIMEDNS